MKKIIFYSLLAGCLTSCSKDLKYTVNGNCEAALEGVSVIFQEVRDGNVLHSDTVKIKDNKFQLKGSIVDPWLVNVFPLKFEDFTPFEVVFEKGNIQIDMTKEYSSVKGTALNDSLQRFKDESREAYQIVRNLSTNLDAKIADGTATPEMQVEYDLKLKEWEKESFLRNMHFVKTNINNPLGRVYFQNLMVYLNPEQRKQMLSFAPEDLKKIYTPQ